MTPYIAHAVLMSGRSNHSYGPRQYGTRPSRSIVAMLHRLFGR